MEAHPLAELFPLMDDKSLKELANSIKENGQREPIVVLGDKILDGRNRFRACELIGVAPIKKRFDGRDPLRFVVDCNLHRRHLNESQRGIIGAKLATLTAGKPNAEIPAITQAEAAELLNISRGTVQAARTVLDLGTPEQVKLVHDGKMRVGLLARELSRERGGVRNKQKVQRMHLNAQIWGDLKDGLNSITNLPLAADVALIAQKHDKAGIIDRKLQQARLWLEDFAHAWDARKNGSP